MNSDDLEKVCTRVVRECTGLSKGETCVLVRDLETLQLHRSLEAAITNVGGVLIVLGLGEKTYLRAPLPKAVEAAISLAAVVIISTKKIFDDSARKAAAKAGARVLSLCKVDEEMVLRALDVDYEDLSQVTKKVANSFSLASEVHIRSERGTDIHFEIKGVPTVYRDGLVRERGSFTKLPAGLVLSTPLPQTAKGKVVLDGSIASIGLLREPVTLIVKSGRVEHIQGGEEAEAFLRIVEGADENGRCIAEVGMGTNPKATYTGNLAEDERVRGSAHIGLGRNTHLGGTIESSLHIDGTIRKPTIYLDGKAIVEKGNVTV